MIPLLCNAQVVFLTGAVPILNNYTAVVHLLWCVIKIPPPTMTKSLPLTNLFFWKVRTIPNMQVSWDYL